VADRVGLASLPGRGKDGSMSGVELSCREVVEILDDYLAGVMPPAERDRLERHLAECEGCESYLDQLRITIHLSGRLTEESVPPAALASLVAAFRAWHRGERPRWRRPAGP
jgi:anti-sigma factor RsiW